jgi:hypothetical protein
MATITLNNDLNTKRNFEISTTQFSQVTHVLSLFNVHNPLIILRNNVHTQTITTSSIVNTSTVDLHGRSTPEHYFGIIRDIHLDDSFVHKKNHVAKDKRVLTYTLRYDMTEFDRGIALKDPIFSETIVFKNKRHKYDWVLERRKLRFYHVRGAIYFRINFDFDFVGNTENEYIRVDDFLPIKEAFYQLSEVNPQMFEGVTTITQLPKNIVNLSETIEDFDSGNIASSLKSISDVLQNLSIDNITALLTDKILPSSFGGGNLFHSIASIGSLVLLCSTSAHLLVGVTDRKVKLFGIASCIFGLVHSDKVKTIVAYCVSYLNKGVESQSASKLAASLSLGALALFLGLPGKEPLKKYMSGISHFDRFSGGLDSIFKHISELFIGFLSWSGLAEYIPVKWRYMFERNDEVKLLAEEAEEIHNSCYEGKFHFCIENQRKLGEVLHKMKELRWNTSNRDSHSAALNYEITFLSKLQEKFSASGYDVNGSRPEPAALMIGGEPGQLKSQFLDIFIQQIAMDYLNDAEMKLYRQNKGSIVYNSSSETGFWDGYLKSHKICIFDDFGQTTDVQGTPDNEYLKWIRAINERPYMLHMADLPNKGNSYFGCDFVLATTNQKTFKPTSIHSANALIRRMHVCVWAELNDGYSKIVNGKRILDESKMPRDKSGKTILSKDMVDFYEWFPNEKNGPSKGKQLTFSEVYKRLRTVYGKNRDNFQTKLELVSSLESETQLPPEMEALFEDEQQDEIDTEIVTNIEPNINKAHEVAKRTDSYADVMRKYHEIYYNEYKQPITSVLLFAGLFTVQGRAFMTGFAIGKTVAEVAITITNGVLASVMDMKEFLSIRSKQGAKQFFKDKRQILSESGSNLMVHLWDYSYHYMTIVGVINLVYHYSWNKGAEDSIIVTDPCMDSSCAGFANYNQQLIDGKVMIKRIPVSKHTCDRKKVPIDATQTWIPYEMYEEKFKFTFTEEELASITQALAQTEITIRDREPLLARLKEAHSQYDLKKREVKFQAGVDVQGRSIIESVKRSNLCVLSYHIFTPEMLKDNSSFQANMLGSILFLRDSLFLTPRHFIQRLKGFLKDPDHGLTLESTIILQKNNGKGLFMYRMFTVADLLESQGLYETSTLSSRDLMLVKLRRGLVSIHRNILSHFALKPPNKTAVLSGYLTNHDGELANLTFTIVPFINVNPSHSSGEERFVLKTPICYDAPTRDGHCGAILALEDATIEKKLFGLHVAGDTVKGVGYGSFFCIEDIPPGAIDELVTDDVVQFQCAYSKDPDIPIAMEQLYDADQSISYPNKTSIIPSVLHNLWPMLPVDCSVLSKTAYRLALDRYSMPPVHFDHMKTKIVADELFRYIDSRSTKCGVAKQLMSWHESAFGKKDCDNFGLVDRSTSPGFPFVFQKGSNPGKTKWLNHGVTKEFTSEGLALVDMCKEKILEMEKLNRQSFIYTDNLKDERVSIEKIIARKTRLFSGCPLDYLLIVRRYFGAFTSWIIENRIKNGVAVGVNPYKEWHEIFTSMSVHSLPEDKGFIAGDFSGFDRSGRQHIYWLMLYKINEWYDDGVLNRNVRMVLWVELVQSRHVHINHVYEWVDSLPSGHPLTTIVNCLYNLFSFRYCWNDIFGFNRNANEIFNNSVYLCTFGDDVHGSVSPDYRDKFNDQIIIPYMAKLGLTYTSDLKDGSIIPLRVLSDITFLKNKYRYCDENGMYVPALELGVILTTPGWTRRKNSTQITIDNVQWCLRHLALWGREVYDEHAPYIIEVFEKKFPRTPLITSYGHNLSDILSLNYVY